MTGEHSPLIAAAHETYDAYEMDALPAELTRDSKSYYYLSVYPGLGETTEFTKDTLPKLPETIESAYIHTPFCTGICTFCSYSLTKDDDPEHNRITTYFDTLKADVIRQQEHTDLNLSYLYFGGGTPSLIPQKTLEGFFEFLAKRDVLSDDRVGTMELHPEFFSDPRRAQTFIDTLRANGIDRVSIGFQSSDEDILDDTNRRHGTNFLQESIDLLKQNNMFVNLDLMYGLPSLSMEQWQRTLEDAVACTPDSISTYFLFLSPHTKMRNQVNRGEIALPPHRDIQIQHIMAQKLLASEGLHELPSDFYSKPGPDVNPDDFAADSLPSDGASLALGSGAYGHYDSTQYFTHFDEKTYRKRVADGESTLWRGHRFEGTDGMNRDVMFALKNSPYIDRNLFLGKYALDPVDHFARTFDNLTRLGLVSVDDTAGRATLTPKGALCVEEIACLFRLPGLRERATKPTSIQENILLTKHHFFPTYPEVSET